MGFVSAAAETGSQSAAELVSSSVFLSVIFSGIGAVGVLYAMAWWIASASRVRYVVDNEQLVAFRGRRVIKAVDLDSLDDVVFDGETSLLGMFIGLGTVWSLYDDLPRLRYRLHRNSGYEEFPAILIIGSDSAQVVRDNLNWVRSRDDKKGAD